MEIREFLKSGLFLKGNNIKVKQVESEKTILSCSAITGYHSIIQDPMLSSCKIEKLLQSKKETIIFIK